MTPEQQQIKIAEACGWKRIPADNVGAAAKLFYGDVWWRDAENNTIASVEQLPDYLNDLNAMHEAEKVLTDTNRYVACLRGLTDRLTNDFRFAHATAAQRAESFLKTLNLWES